MDAKKKKRNQEIIQEEDFHVKDNSKSALVLEKPKSLKLDEE